MIAPGPVFSAKLPPNVKSPFHVSALTVVIVVAADALSTVPAAMLSAPPAPVVLPFPPSAVACFRNFGAHLLYGLAWLAVFLAVGSVFGLIGGLIGGATMARAVMMPTALLMAAMFSTSIYFTFRDSFSATPEPEQQPPGEPT